MGRNPSMAAFSSAMPSCFTIYFNGRPNIRGDDRLRLACRPPSRYLRGDRRLERKAGWSRKGGIIGPISFAWLSAAIGITAAIHAAMTKEDPRAAIAWVGVILLSPFVGAFIYLVAGINRIRRTSIGNKRFRAESRQHRQRDPGQGH
jgi:hypothetical protein